MIAPVTVTNRTLPGSRMSESERIWLFRARPNTGLRASIEHGPMVDHHAGLEPLHEGESPKPRGLCRLHSAQASVSFRDGTSLASRSCGFGLYYLRS